MDSTMMTEMVTLTEATIEMMMEAMGHENTGSGDR